MKQPKLSLKNDEIVEQFPQLKTNTPTQPLIVAMGDSFTARNGEEQVPLLIVQVRTDTKQNSGAAEAADFFRGWGGASRLVRHIENATLEQVESNGLEVGKTLPGFNIQVERSTTPFYGDSFHNDGRTDQEPVQSPQGDILMEGDDPVYEQTFIVKGAPTHKGLTLGTITRKAISVTQSEGAGVVESESA